MTTLLVYPLFNSFNLVKYTMTYEETDGEPLWIVGYGSLLFKPPLHHMEDFQLKKFPGYMSGYIRRFWQSSYDNRGTPEQKGRVVTVIPLEDILENKEFQDDVLNYELRNHCDSDNTNTKYSLFDAKNYQVLKGKLSVWGCIYYIPPQHAQQVAEYLDFREKDGYTTHHVDFTVVLGDIEDNNTAELHNILDKLPKNSLGEPVVKSVIYMGTTENESFVGPESVKDTAKVINVCAGDSGPNDEYLFKIHSALKTLDPLGKDRAADVYLDTLMNELKLIRGKDI